MIWIDGWYRREWSLFGRNAEPTVRGCGSRVRHQVLWGFIVVILSSQQLSPASVLVSVLAVVVEERQAHQSEHH